MLIQDFVKRVVDDVPFGEELAEGGFALGGEAVEALVALIFFAPFAGEEALGFEAAEEGVESAFLDGEALVGEGFAEGVAVVLGTELGEDGDDEAAAAEFKAEGVELGVWRDWGGAHTV